jgi:uncharacterized protein (DUF1800 family)
MARYRKRRSSGTRSIHLKTETIIAANRFGFGARPGDLQEIDKNPTGWLLSQLEGPSRLPTEINSLPKTPEVLVEVLEIRQMQRAGKSSAEDEPAPDVVRKFGSIVRRHYLEQTDVRFRIAATTDLPFHERLVHFWANHFAISADKPPVSALVGLFENEAIRPNISGKFTDLLLAVEKHPAMIVYLDNQRSIGPDSTVGKRANGRRGRNIGLNENLAREILELHTLGVDGGYTQEDVTTFASVISGWSIGGGDDRRFAEGTPGEFEFRESLHEPGSKTILGKTYKQSGIKQGEAVLKDLAARPATAEFIATKLVRHFVADEPPSGMVARIAKVFLDSGGDLPSVHAALVTDELAWQDVYAKYKTPQDFVISTFRAFDREPDNVRFVTGALDLMGQMPYRPGSPAGWPDTAAAWGGADALYKRIEWSNTVARYAGNRVNPLDLADAVLGPTLGDHTRTAISRAESFEQGITLLLVSPEFQRR